jgi:hypothetical protein
VVAAASAAAACHGDRAQAARSEAGEIARAVQMIRDAPNDGKRVLLPQLREMTCTAPDRCTLKLVCAGAYGEQIAALDELEVLRVAARDGGDLPPQASLLSNRATLELAQAKQLAEQCVDLEGDARRRYAL